jgi:hypothetical protein
MIESTESKWPMHDKLIAMALYEARERERVAAAAAAQEPMDAEPGADTDPKVENTSNE